MINGLMMNALLKQVEEKPQNKMFNEIVFSMIVKDGVEYHNHMRVDVNPDGTFNIVDFTLPSLGDKLRRNVPQEDVPQWMMESISMLRIVNEGEHVPHVGLKISDRAYYVYDRTGESDD